jgi:uncharacterized protein
MPAFKLFSESITGERAIFHYDSDNSTLTDDSGRAIVDKLYSGEFVEALVCSPDSPNGKTDTVRILKISLGMSCNYSCSYCNQHLNPVEVEQTNQQDIGPFVELLQRTLKPQEQFMIQFWGGEPFVYWKTLRPLAERLRVLFPDAEFSVITNGSLLDHEKVEWLDAMNFTVGISHDGPNYHARGQDPLAQDTSARAIQELYQRLSPRGKISVNSMLHAGNESRAAINEFMVSRFGPNVRIGEGGVIDPYEPGGLAASLDGFDQHSEFRRRAFDEIRKAKARNFLVIEEKISGFVRSLETRRPKASVGQKCGMDLPGNLAVDLRGNVLTCQNTSAKAVAPNGRSHNIGHLSELGNARLHSARHWSTREECPNCPVLHLCQGACMFLEGDLWDAGCDNAFSDNVVFLAAAIEFLTGFVPVYIEGPQREDRKDIWGLNGVPVTPSPRKKIIPLVPA